MSQPPAKRSINWCLPRQSMQAMRITRDEEITEGLKYINVGWSKLPGPSTTPETIDPVQTTWRNDRLTWDPNNWIRKCSLSFNGLPPHSRSCNCALKQFEHVPIDLPLFLAVSTESVTCREHHGHFPENTCELCDEKHTSLMYLFKVREKGGDLPEEWSSNTYSLPRRHINVLCSSCYHGFRFEPVKPFISGTVQPISPVMACPFDTIYGITLPSNNHDRHEYHPTKSKYTENDTFKQFPFLFEFVVLRHEKMPLKSAAQSTIY